MQKDDLIRRLSNRKKIEASLQADQEVILKMVNKYIKSLNKTKATIDDEIAKEESNQRRLRGLDKTNKKLARLLQQAETKSREYANLQTEYEHFIRKQSDEIMRKCIKKELTNVFLDTKALPVAAQGMIVCQDQWIPFNFPINSFDMSKVPLEFWSHTQRHSKFHEQWENLVLDSISLN